MSKKIYKNKIFKSSRVLKFLGIAASITIALSVWIGISTHQGYVRHEKLELMNKQAMEVQKTILWYDEILTMSARASSLSGDLKWERRYNKYEPELDKLIKKAQRIFSTTEISGKKTDAVDQTDRANIKLVEMEKTAFKLIKQKRLEEAQSILFSKEYETQKRLYTEGMKTFDVLLMDFSNKIEKEMRNEKLFITAIEISLFITLFLVWGIVIIVVRNWERAFQKSNNELEVEVDERTKKLIMNEEKYRTLFKSMLNGFAFHKIVTDENSNPIDYTFLETNDAFETLTGLKEADILGKKVTEVIPGIEKDEFDWIGEYGKVALTGKELRRTQHFQPLDKWYSIYAYSPQKDYFAVIFEDITDRKKANDELKDSEEKFRTVVNNFPAVTFIIDKEGIFKLSEGKSLATLGLKGGQVVGMSAFDIYKDHPQILEGIRKALSGVHVNEIIELQGLVFDTYYTPIKNTKGEVVDTVGVATDITKRIEDEKEKAKLKDSCARASKLADIGMLAAGVAHEVNNPLSIVKGNIEMIELDIEEGNCEKESVLMKVKTVLDAIDRIGSILNELRLYSKVDKVDNNNINLRESIENTLKLVTGPYQKEGVELESELDNEIMVFGNNNKVQQVLMNLLSNAKDAVKNNKEKVIHITLSKEDDRAKIKVKDTGCGMKKEVLNKVFSTFYTTKGKEGTGMGMGIVESMVQDMKGVVNIESKENKGTLVVIDFPLSNKKAA